MVDIVFIDLKNPTGCNVPLTQFLADDYRDASYDYGESDFYH